MSIYKRLPVLLENLSQPGSFFASGSVELPLIQLRVPKVGTLGFPLSTFQAKALLEVASPAPYGKGPNTVLDPMVRSCAQLDPKDFDASDARFQQVLHKMLQTALQQLGVVVPARAELYKLLLYKPGDFFTAHRDSEKVAGMFGTLVVSLPSYHTGGALVIEHNGENAKVVLTGEDLGLAYWAAFYADCKHTLEKVIEGYRLVLIYNLVSTQKKNLHLPDLRKEVASVSTLLGQWIKDEDAPYRLVSPLKHRYTDAELSFGSLKNEDFAAASVLLEAAK